MNQSLLKRRAFELDSVLSKYETKNTDAARLRQAIGPLLKKAESGQMTDPIETSPLPGARLFEDGSLGTVVELANAFGSFAIEVTGGAPPSLQEFRRSNGYDPMTGDKLSQ